MRDHSKWRRGAGSVIVIAAAVLALTAPPAPAPTLASWTDSEYGTGSLTAGTVSPPTNLHCTAGLLQPARFFWDLPSGGVTRTGFHWTVTGGLSGSGDLGPTVTTVELNSGLIGLGSGTFTLYAQGPGQWQSTTVSGSLSLIKIILDVNSTCSVP